MTVWPRPRGIALCLAVDENGRAAAVEPLTKTEFFPPKHPEFQLVGKRVEISWVCQINMDLVVSHKARLAHHKYCFTHGVDLGFTFSVCVDEAGLGMSH